MAVDWRVYCRGKQFEVDGSDVVVQCGDQRRQRVSVEDRGNAYFISARVAPPRYIATIPNLPLQVWLRNRATMLVGFWIDERHRLMGEAWIPKPGLTAQEFQEYLRTLAVECDRFEYALTGRDDE